MSTIFIAWSSNRHESGPEAETEKRAALSIKDRLEAEGFDVFMSPEIAAGTPFGEIIRREIRDASLVISVFPPQPSFWQAAEAGLAYFEKKLLPICVRTESTIDPFSDLQALQLAPGDIGAEGGETMDNLVETVRQRVGGGGSPVMYRCIRAINTMFFWLVPVLGFAAEIVCLVLFQLDMVDYNLLRGAHMVSGSVVFGGGIFAALMLARSGVSLNLSEHRFGYHTARRLFGLWFAVAVLQVATGSFLAIKIFGFGWPVWLASGMVVYLLALIFGLLGFQNFAAAYRLVKATAPRWRFNHGSSWGISCCS